MTFTRRERDYIQRLKNRRDVLVARINDAREFGNGRLMREWQKEYEAVDWAIKQLYAAEDGGKK